MFTKKLIAFAIITIVISSCINSNNNAKNETVYKRTEKNYGKQVAKYSEKFFLNANYLKALIILECSGQKKPPARFEKHIYDKLIMLKEGNIDSFEDITHEMIKDTPESIIKEMASSWGPFQIMGYKCVNLNINIDDLKGENNFFFSTKWIDDTYGNFVRTKRYKDAFHIHNAGKMYPDSGETLTYDKNYVTNGLKYIQYFHEQDSLRYYGKSNFKINVKTKIK